MVGLRGSCWTFVGVFLALSCGRTASSDHVASSGAGSGVGGTGSGVVTGGSGPTVAGSTSQAGEPAAAGAPAECPATPIAGRWIARGPDAYGLELKNDGTQVSGQGCLGGFGAPGAPSPLGCDPLTVLADTGRSFHFVWDAGPSLGSPYVMKMQLTVSPERNAMAGKLWSSYVGLDGEGVDIVFVPSAGELALPATICSGGQPSGACFLAPLRADRVHEPRVVELSEGDLLLLWRNQRGDRRHAAAARFDATSGSWQPPEFLDDGSARVDSLLLSTSSDGWAMVAYTQESALLTRAYSPKTKAWSKPSVVVRAERANVLPPSGLFVYDGGDALLVAATQPVDSVGEMVAYDYSAAQDAWVSSIVLEATPENAYEWAVGSDKDRRQLVTWVRGGAIDKPHELWFSSRSSKGDWSAPARFFSSDYQILRPAVAIGTGGSAMATWQEWTHGINSSSYSFEGASWSEPAMVTTETQRDNRVVRFDHAGTPVSYFYDNNALSGERELKSELANGLWGPPQPCTALEVNDETYTLVAGTGDLTVERVVPGQAPHTVPSLERPRCEGY